MENEKKEKKRKSPTAFRMGTMLIIILLTLVGFGLYIWGPEFELGNENVSIGTLYFIFFIFGYLGSSLRSVGVDEIGGILFYGRYLKDADYGIHLVLRGIYQLQKDSGLVVALNFPADPERIFKEGDDKSLPAGMVRPSRITTASPELAEKEKFTKSLRLDYDKDVKNDKLNVRLTLEPSWIVRVRIKKDEYDIFLRNVGSMEDMISQIRDTSERGLNQEFSRRTVVMINTDRQKIDKELKKLLKNLVGDVYSIDENHDWGVEIISFQLLDLDLTHAVNKAIADSAAAPINAQAVIDESIGEAKATAIKGKSTNKVAAELYDKTTERTNQKERDVAKLNKEALESYKGQTLAINQPPATPVIPLK